MYRLIKDKITGNVNTVCRLADNAYIPFDQQNRDYVEYLKWLSEGNQPLPVDEEQK